MANNYKILGQVSLTEAVISNVYVSPTSTSTIVSSINITNRGDLNSSYALLVRPINEDLSDKHYIVRGGVIPAREVVTISGAITMNADVILAANTNDSNVTVSAFGVEIS